jgi:hypothetical protein
MLDRTTDEVVSGVLLELLESKAADFYTTEHVGRLREHLTSAARAAAEREMVEVFPLCWWTEEEAQVLVQGAVTDALVEWDLSMADLLANVVDPVWRLAVAARRPRGLRRDADPPSEFYLEYRRQVLCHIGGSTTRPRAWQLAIARDKAGAFLDLEAEENLTQEPSSFFELSASNVIECRCGCRERVRLN